MPDTASHFGPHDTRSLMAPPGRAPARRTVLVVDDQAIVRAGVSAMLQNSTEYDVIGAVEDGARCLEEVAAQQPDFLLLDLRMPGLDGFAVLQGLPARSPGTSVLVLTAMDDAQSLQRALHHGAKGYISKDMVADELLYALRCVAGGRVYISPSVTMSQSTAATPEMGSSESRPVDLSARQLQVLKGIALGKSNKVMAREFDISVKTVEYHRAELMQRLGIHDIAGLTRYALRWYPPTD